MFRITAPGIDCLKGTPTRARQVALRFADPALHHLIHNWNPRVSLDLSAASIRIMPCTPPIS
jgi:hypothetical protein